MREVKSGRGSPHGGVFLDIAWIREKLKDSEAHIRKKLRGTAEGLAPAIAGRSVQDPGQELSLAALRGRPTLVYFWATWCGVCEHVDPNVASVARDHQVLTVAVNSGRPSAIAAWMQERGLEMPTVGDPSGVLARAYGVRAFPTSFWVDGEGQIQNREVGYTSTLGLRVRLWLVR